MTDENVTDTENSPKFGSGCLLPFIFFFGFSFYCGVKDGNDRRINSRFFDHDFFPDKIFTPETPQAEAVLSAAQKRHIFSRHV